MMPYTTENETGGGYPKNSFLTCSSDGSVRFWNLNNEQENKSSINKELLKIAYLDPQWAQAIRHKKLARKRI